ncbi:MAG: universal stress protein [Proteobacteria bacterium]|nr:universal stress protein [Pseudomonadota bacterium]
MGTRLLHIFRNTPLGRETLFQSAYFCKQTGFSLVIYIPRFKKFLMYFKNDAVQVDLDDSYLVAHKTAEVHAKEITESLGIEPVFIQEDAFTASTLPDIPSDFDFMCCPRSISDMSSKVSLGHIGSPVRRIVRSAKFPILITSPVFKPWKSIAVMFGGSRNSVKALKLGFRMARKTGMPLDIFTQIEKPSTRKEYKAIVTSKNFDKNLSTYLHHWYLFEKHQFEENLYDVPHDALVVLGAYGHGVIKDILFGSKMETIQSTLSNNLLVVGPKYSQVNR